MSVSKSNVSSLHTNTHKHTHAYNSWRSGPQLWGLATSPRGHRFLDGASGALPSCNIQASAGAIFGRFVPWHQQPFFHANAAQIRSFQIISGCVPWSVLWNLCNPSGFWKKTITFGNATVFAGLVGKPCHYPCILGSCPVNVLFRWAE